MDCPATVRPFLEDVPRWSGLVPKESEGAARVLFVCGPSQGMPPQSFSLQVSPIHIEARASDGAGLFYAAMTLRQLIRQYASIKTIPCLCIQDAPDYPVRGYILDISRNRVPTRRSLFDRIEMLAECRINQLSLYAAERRDDGGGGPEEEGVFSFSEDERAALDEQGRRHFIELIYDQGSRDTGARFQGKKTDHAAVGPFGQAPETREGEGAKIRVWADVLTRHPEWMADPPQGMVALHYSHEMDADFLSAGSRFIEMGIPCYVCPGTSAWNSIAGRWDHARANLLAAAEQGVPLGASGYVIADWAGVEHWQHPSISLPSLLYGAALAWGQASNRDLDVGLAIDTHVAGRQGEGGFGEALRRMGNLYRVCRPAPRNASTLFHLLFHCNDSLMPPTAHMSGATHEALQCVKAQLDEIDIPVPRSSSPQEEALYSEIRNAHALLNHATCLGLARLDYHGAKPGELPETLRASAREEWDALLAEFHRIWMRGSRPDGYAANTRALHRLRNAYGWHESRTKPRLAQQHPIR